MKENTIEKKNDSEQSYVRLIRYLRKQQEAANNETSHTKKTDCNQSK